MDNLFGFPSLRIQQPGKLLPTRASYEIFNGARQLLATATEAEARSRVKLLPQGVPATRMLTVTTVGGSTAFTLTTHTREHLTELAGPGGEPFGQIRGRYTNRHYTLVDEQRQTVGKVVGDLGLKHFSVTDPAGAEFARIRKTFAGITKEMLTPSDHYKVDFAGPVAHPARVLTVMIAIVLDLTLYEPA
ncbi:MAG: phospholipid scramblase-related protein [Gemmatimonadota bacterium]